MNVAEVTIIQPVQQYGLRIRLPKISITLVTHIILLLMLPTTQYRYMDLEESSNSSVAIPSIP